MTATRKIVTERNAGYSSRPWYIAYYKGDRHGGEGFGPTEAAAIADLVEKAGRGMK